MPMKKTGYALVPILATTLSYLAYKIAKKKLLNAEKITKCIVIESVTDWYAHEEEIIRVLENSKVIGLDCEWVSNEGKRDYVSLLQLANESGFCVLVRLCCMPAWSIPNEINKILINQKILKVGVGIYEDASKLFDDYGLEVTGLLDLRFLASDLKELQDKNLGLKSLSYELLNLDLNKTNRVRCSDWSAPTLTNEQIKYAAEDVIVAANLYHEIKRRKTMWLGGFEWSFSKKVNNYVDVQYKQKFALKDIIPNQTSSSSHKENKYGKPRMKPMYGNSQLIAPDGEVLCICDKKKAEWYVMKGLGEVVDEHPLRVKLNFEPSGRPTLDNTFYTIEKANCCVVCGKTDQYHRKLVIPSEYRKYFPNLMKKSLSHDVLLLCVSCHKKSNTIDQILRQKLAEMCDAPLGCDQNVKFKRNPECRRVKLAATAIIKANDKLPQERKAQIEQTIKDYFKVLTVDEDILAKAMEVDINAPSDSYTPHGKKVYEYFCKNGGLIKFELLWRQHFLDTMQPKYLPSMWSVDHNHKRLVLKVINQEIEVDFDTSILGINPALLEEIKNVK